MNNTVTQAIVDRVSIHRFESGGALPQALLETLVDLATRAPSAYNLQNWKFIAVQSPEGKARLKEVSFGQQKVVDAAVTLIVCGTLESHGHLAGRLAPSVQEGLMTQATSDAWSDMATLTHTDNPQLQRDEALRSASLAAMTLMLAAQEAGLCSCPMSGFDSQALSEAFELDSHDVPVLLVTLGYPATHEERQKIRRPLSDVLQYA